MWHREKFLSASRPGPARTGQTGNRPAGAPKPDEPGFGGIEPGVGKDAATWGGSKRLRWASLDNNVHYANS